MRESCGDLQVYLSKQKEPLRLDVGATEHTAHLDDREDCQSAAHVVVDCVLQQEAAHSCAKRNIPIQGVKGIVSSWLVAGHLALYMISSKSPRARQWLMIALCARAPPFLQVPGC